MQDVLHIARNGLQSVDKTNGTRLGDEVSQPRHQIIVETDVRRGSRAVGDAIQIEEDHRRMSSSSSAIGRRPAAIVCVGGCNFFTFASCHARASLGELHIAARQMAAPVGQLFSIWKAPLK